MQLQEMTFGDFVDGVASRTPVPGGGAVAASIAALATALGRMVIEFSIGKRTYAEHEPAHRAALERLTQLGHAAIAAAGTDAAAYERLNALWKLDEDDAERVAAWDDAVAAAIAAPREVMTIGLDTLDASRALATCTNRMLASDLMMAAILAEAAVRCGACNVRINLPLVGDATSRGEFEGVVERDMAAAATLLAKIETAIAER